MLKILRFAPFASGSVASRDDISEIKEVAPRAPALTALMASHGPLVQLELPSAPTVRFGDFILSRNPLSLADLEGRTIPLQRQPLICLDCLVRSSPGPLSREEIRDAIWGEDHFIDYDQGINFIICRIRTALKDDAREPSYVETLPRVGYRFVASVQCLPSSEQESPVEIPRPGRRWLPFLVLLLTASVFLAGLPKTEVPTGIEALCSQPGEPAEEWFEVTNYGAHRALHKSSPKRGFIE